MPRRLLYALLVAQALAQLFWLSPAAHSGQVAVPWMMNRGLRLFGEIWEQHAPGSSVLAATAQSLTGIDPGLLVKLLNIALVLALTSLVYALATRLASDERAGLLGALVFAWQAPVYGNVMLYFDTLVALCVMAALALYFHGSQRISARRIAAAGLLMGLSALFKQQAFLAAGALGLWLLLSDGSRRLALIYAAASLCFPLMQWLALWADGLLESYLFWNWSFNLSGAMDGVPLDGDLFRKLLLTNALVFPYIAMRLRGERRHLLLVALWLAGLTLLYPRAGENHAMAHLPFTAVMSGVVLARLLPQLTDWRGWDAARAALAGLLVAVGLGWLWTGAVSFIPTPLGPGAILAYDEFRELAAEIKARADEGDTLFILPQADSTPQLHPLTGLPPPGTWVKGWPWYFKPERVLTTLIAEWEQSPPAWVVVFPRLIAAGEPGIRHLLDIVERRYQLAFTIERVHFHGEAQVWQLAERGGQAAP